jgi:hypothetical protein
MGHAIKFADNLHQAVVGTDGVGIAATVIHNIVHLYMTAKANNLITNGVLESQYHANRYYHNCQTDSHSDSCYTNSGATNFSFVALVTIYFLSYV